MARVQKSSVKKVVPVAKKAQNSMKHHKKTSKITVSKAQESKPKRAKGGDWACSLDNCQKSFGDRSSLKRHIDGFHLKLFQVKCLAPGCGKTYVDQFVWKAHAKKHDGEPKCEKIEKNRAVVDKLPGQSPRKRNIRSRAQIGADSVEDKVTEDTVSGEGMSGTTSGGMDIGIEEGQHEDVLVVNLNRRLGDTKFWANRHLYMLKRK